MARPSEARERLRELLAADGFLEWNGGPGPRDRTGRPLPWLFYGPQVTLTPAGLSLAAAVILDRLGCFQSTQLATYGVSALPLLGACVVNGGGRYTGLAVRREPKAYGSCRQIDGPIDRSRSVVMVDESITAGRSMYEGIRILEAEGLRVEGAVCLVEFAGYGAVPWLMGSGYRVETVFNVWQELGRRAVTPRLAPTSIEHPRASSRLPDGLSPAQVARSIAAGLRETGAIPTLPNVLDRGYDARGGTYVSVRRRADDERLARAGFRRDTEDPVDVAQEVALATAEALTDPHLREVDLAEVKFAVSLMGQAQPTALAGIDHEVSALLVRGIGPLDRVGMALPNAPHYDDEIQQYRYARTIAASFPPHEPTLLFRQSVHRDVEPGEQWPEYGAPRPGPGLLRNADFAEALAGRLRTHLGGSNTSVPVVLPGATRVNGVGVSLYDRGLVGCAMSFLEDFDAALAEATARALADQRFVGADRGATTDGVVAVVSLLGPERRLGVVADNRLPLFFRLGVDTLMASAGARRGLILAHFAVEQSVEADAYRKQVERKAGIESGQVHWTAWETWCWRVDADGPAVPLDHGFPVPYQGHGEQFSALTNRLAKFVLAQRQADGLPAYYVQAWSGRAQSAGPAARILLTLAALFEAEPFLEADVNRSARAMLDGFVRDGVPTSPRPDLTWDRGTDAQLLSTLGLLREWGDEHVGAVDVLVRRLQPLIRPDGAIYHLGARRIDADLDILAGIVILGLARVRARHPAALAEVDLEAVLAFYKRRFSLLHPWSMVWWHSQAWAALAVDMPAAGEFALEIADWALERQSERSGGFVIDSLPPYRNSFLSACVLEGVAAAWDLALDRGDWRTAEGYERAWERGMHFIERLVIKQDDVFFSPSTGLDGGVRATLVSCDVRIDFVGHTLLALVKGLRARGRARTLRASPRASRSLVG